MAKILLVEDNEMNRDLISRRLTRAGYEVALAVDGAEGIDKVKSEAPDLVIMDMGLPILDGYEATRVLKGGGETRHIPVLGLSAHAMSGDAAKALEAGCDDYDTKPVEWPRLQLKIKELLSQAQATTIMAMPRDLPGANDEGGQAATIFLASESAMFRKVVGQRLDESGHRFEFLEEAGQILPALQGGAGSALLLDVRMGGEGVARDLVREIRADASLQEIPILMLCQIDAIPAVIECLQLGADDYVPQPFHREILDHRLGRALARPEDAVASAEPSLNADELEAERRRSDYLLNVLLPSPLVDELRDKGRVAPRRCLGVAIWNGQLPNLHRLCDGEEPLLALSKLQQWLAIYEEVAPRHGMVTVRLAGDALIAAVGLFEPVENPVLAALNATFEIQEAARQAGIDWTLRCGIHFGDVMAGVVGRRRYQFDLWGTSLELAALARSHGQSGNTFLSAPAWQQVADYSTGGPVGQASLRDGGSLMIYRVDKVTGRG